MNYIISEAQSRLFEEWDWHLWLRRRATPDHMRTQIDYSKQLHRDVCDWPNEYDYAGDVIGWVVDDFIATHEELYSSDRSDDYHAVLVDHLKDLYAEELFEFYRNNCEEKDMEIEIE